MAAGGSPSRRFETAYAEGRWADAELIARSQLTRDLAAQGWAASALARCAAARRDLPALRLWLERAGRIVTRTPDLTDFQVSLLLQAGDLDGAADLLERHPDADPAARLSSGTARALASLQRGRREEARGLIEALLRRHPVTAATSLAGLADHLVKSLGLAGWVACQGGPMLTGLLGGDGEIRLEGPQARTWTAAAFRAAFGEPHFIVPIEDGAGPWSLLIDGRPLLGSGLMISRAPIEGVIEIEGDRLSGWATHRDDPALPLVRVTDQKGQTLDLPLKSGREFSLSLAGSGLGLGRLFVTANGEALAGSPVLWEKRTKPAQPIRVPPQRTKPPVPARDPVIDIVIPVYGERAATLACLERVLTTTRRDKANVVVIDDATPDATLAAALDAEAQHGRITLLRNPVNLGFPASVNRGMALHPKRDVVLLNSDALVSGTWLRRLKAAATAAPDTGSATALSNEASICSYGPQTPEEWPGIDRLARRVNRSVTVELPTAVGFCMYIRRDCLRETGDFSEVLFGRGYGEENDFCLRARSLGWRHVAAADVFVGHVGGASFGSARALLQERNLKVLEGRHPGYQKLVSRFSAADPLAPARRRMDLGRWTPSARPAVLLVTLAMEGGASRHVEERRQALERTGRRVLLLAPAPARHTGRGPVQRCRLSDPAQPELQDMVFDSDAELETLAELLRRVPVERMEIHHSLDHHPAILELPARLGVPYEMVLHDYHWLCPRVALTLGDGRYCGEPQPSLPHCEACLLELGSESGEEITVAALRQWSGRLLAGARRVVAPSHDVAERYRRYFPGVVPEVVPWDQVTPPHSAQRHPHPDTSLAPSRHSREGGNSWTKTDIAADAAQRLDSRLRGNDGGAVSPEIVAWDQVPAPHLVQAPPHPDTSLAPSRHSREGGNPALHAAAWTKTDIAADAARRLDSRLRGNDGGAVSPEIVAWDQVPAPHLVQAPPHPDASLAPSRHSREGGNPALHAAAWTKTDIAADAAQRLDSRLRGNDGVGGGDDGGAAGEKSPTRTRVAVIGAIGPHKGYEELRACALDAAARDLPLEFIVVGYSHDDAGLFATGRVHVTGQYQEEEAEALIRRQGASAAFIASVCPETWCYALSLAWQADLAAVAFDLGAPAERIRAQGGGTVLPFGASPAAINDALLALSTGFVVDGKANPTNHSEQKESPMTQSPQIAATPQEMTLVPGFYAITVTRGGARPRPGRMALPAILISAPVEANGRVEILASHTGGWMTRQGDTVMLKVMGETSILMTSFKDPLAPQETLDVQVSRVDGPAASVAAMAPPLPSVEILAHVQRVGDQTYAGADWAGVPGRGQAIEGFALIVKGGITADEIEYKAVTANGWETPWMPGGQFCGTRSQGLPLIGVAIRLKGAAAQRFDASVEAVFVNGGKAGPARNGAPCRSDVIGAPLDGLKLSFSGKA